MVSKIIKEGKGILKGKRGRKSKRGRPKTKKEKVTNKKQDPFKIIRKKGESYSFRKRK